MKKFLLPFFIAVAAVPAYAVVPEWITFRSGPGRFSVLMPGPDEPKLNSETKSAPGTGTYTSYLFTQRSEKGIFLVGWADYPSTFKFGIQAELGANRDNFLTALKARLISERGITLGTNPGIEFAAEAEKVCVRSRVYIVGSRPYQLIAATFEGMDDTANVDRFFASFKLTGEFRPASLIAGY
jgi:hypothetical protein